MSRAIKQKLPHATSGSGVAVYQIDANTTALERTLDANKAKGNGEVVFVLNKTTSANVNIYLNIPDGYEGLKFTVLKKDSTLWTIKPLPGQANPTDNMFKINGDISNIPTIYSSVGRPFDAITLSQHVEAGEGVKWVATGGNGYWADGIGRSLLVSNYTQ